MNKTKIDWPWKPLWTWNPIFKGRLKFGDSKNSAPFPSMVVVFRRLQK